MFNQSKREKVSFILYSFYSNLLSFFLLCTEVVALFINWFSSIGFIWFAPILIWKWGLIGALWLIILFFVITSILPILLPVVLISFILLTIKMISLFGFIEGLLVSIPLACVALGIIKWDSYSAFDLQKSEKWMNLKVVIYQDLREHLYSKMNKKDAMCEKKRSRIRKIVAEHVNDTLGCHDFTVIPVLNNHKLYTSLEKFIGYPDTSYSAIKRIVNAFDSGIKGELARKYWLRRFLKEACKWIMLGLVVWFFYFKF